MAPLPTQVLRSYLLGRPLLTRQCLRIRSPTPSRSPSLTARRWFQTDTTDAVSTTPFRAHLKNTAKKRKAEAALSRNDDAKEARLKEWELTVGIEIHAVLNTPRKLFSPAPTKIDAVPNSQISAFDIALPGSQPVFEKATVIPAIRAALALNCQIRGTSSFDRKHYFHWDQPAGYQITQYYRSFAHSGHVTLHDYDGIATEDGDAIRIDIKQVQLEQDTAKTILQGSDQHLLDFNRSGVPLIEIITMPQIHHPRTAAAFVRKVQAMLDCANACVLGMEAGGLRADINVSVRRRNDDSKDNDGNPRLGQRTEIKNLSSFKAVEDAIIAERDRQIDVLEGGGVILGETRGWTLGSTETRRLRGKEGEVDYRYMPDPDIPPLFITKELVEHLRQTSGMSRDDELNMLVDEFGLTMKDAKDIATLDDGRRAVYFYRLVESVAQLGSSAASKSDGVGGMPREELGRICANWVLHELGGLREVKSGELKLFPRAGFNFDCIVAVEELAHILSYALTKQITTKVAKQLLPLIVDPTAEQNQTGLVKRLLDEKHWWQQSMSEAEYRELAQKVMKPDILERVLQGDTKKMGYFMGQMMRLGDNGRVDPGDAMAILTKMIEEERERRTLEQEKAEGQ